MVRDIIDAIAATTGNTATTYVGAQFLESTNNLTPRRFVWVRKRIRSEPADRVGGRPRVLYNAAHMLEVHVIAEDESVVELLWQRLTTAIRAVVGAGGFSASTDDAVWTEHVQGVAGAKLVIAVALRLPMVVTDEPATQGALPVEQTDTQVTVTSVKATPLNT